MAWWNQNEAVALAPTSADWVRVMRELAPDPPTRRFVKRDRRARRARALRLLEEATRQLIRVGAGMQHHGIDTAPLADPAVLMSDVIKLLHDD